MEDTGEDEELASKIRWNWTVKEAKVAPWTMVSGDFPPGMGFTTYEVGEKERNMRKPAKLRICHILLLLLM